MTSEVSPLVYAALGDSTGVGVGAADGRGYVVRLFERLKDVHPRAQLGNLCTSGAMSGDLLRQQLPRALALAPRLVTVFIGINDLLHGVSPPTFGKHIGQLAEAIAAHGARALFCTLPDLTHSPAVSSFLPNLGVSKTVFEARTLAFNAYVLDHARLHGHRVHDLFVVALRDRAHFFSPDGFHPSAHGYEELAVQLWPELEQMLNEEPRATPSSR